MEDKKEKEGYEYGQPIPQKYRNRLFDWEGGGYDGNFWEMNQGLVDKDGHWHPIYSTGINGIDLKEWYKRKIDALKAECGYDVRPAKVQLDEAIHKAIGKVFGKKWYEVEGDPFGDERVEKLVKDDRRKYREFVTLRDGYRLERMHRLDAMFMQVVCGEMERDRFEEVGLIDKDHVKETCKAFCERYGGNVGLMTRVLDEMAELGYDVWCTCTDCGEQFQRYRFETFVDSLDRGSYVGDGGVGVIMKRVLCDACRDNVECLNCFELDIPNPRSSDGGTSEWTNYDFLACVLHEWIGVCWGCANGFEAYSLSSWDDARRQRVRTDLGAKYERIEEGLKLGHVLEGHALYEQVVKTKSGRAMINRTRDLLQDAVASYFSSLDEELLNDRLDEHPAVQAVLPGME